MKIKLNYLLIPLITVLVSLVGSWLTNQGMAWYDTLNLPSWTPPGFVIGIVWTVIFILTTISALIVWNRRFFKPTIIGGYFILNAALNVYWSFLFFYQGQIAASIWEMIALNLTTLILIVLIWKKSKTAAGLLIPYFLWVTFATYLAYNVWLLNK